MATIDKLVLESDVNLEEMSKDMVQEYCDLMLKNTESELEDEAYLALTLELEEESL